MRPNQSPTRARTGRLGTTHAIFPPRGHDGAIDPNVPSSDRHRNFGHISGLPSITFVQGGLEPVWLSHTLFMVHISHTNPHTRTRTACVQVQNERQRRNLRHMRHDRRPQHGQRRPNPLNKPPERAALAVASCCRCRRSAASGGKMPAARESSRPETPPLGKRLAGALWHGPCSRLPRHEPLRS